MPYSHADTDLWALVICPHRVGNAQMGGSTIYLLYTIQHLLTVYPCYRGFCSFPLTQCC